MRGKFFTIAGFLFLLMGILMTVGCGGDDNKVTNPPSPQPTNLIRITGFAYSPTPLSVGVGDTVTWRNDDSVPHTVTSDSGTELQSPILNSGNTYQHIFTVAGSFSYHCTVHSTMPHATVNVQ